MARHHGNRFGGKQHGGKGHGGQQKGKLSNSQDSVPVVSADKCAPPYHFVPVTPELAVLDEPVFHDVQHTGEQFVSGALHCTLTALTPLIAGNYQFDYQHMHGKLKQAFERLLDKNGVHEKVAAKKKVLEPLRLPGTVNGVDQPVVIPGEALKGLLRQTLQSLLSSPMERVRERTFSFRPNIAVPEAPVIRIVPAVVLGIQESDEGPVLVVQPLEPDRGKPNPHPVVFLNGVHSAPPVAPSALSKTDAPGNLATLHRCAKLSSFNCYRSTNANRPVSKQNRPPKPKDPKKAAQWDRDWVSGVANDYLLLSYETGLDGAGSFSQAFNNGNSGYSAVLAHVPSRLDAVFVPAPVVRQYSRTLQQLGNEKTGHITKSHPLRDKLPVNTIQTSLRELETLSELLGKVVFLEIRGSGANSLEVVTIGHHFRYRWAYRDSIQYQKQRLRALLCPAEPEQKIQPDGGHPGAPQKLTAARRLFGYVAQDRDAANPNQPLTFQIGSSEERFEDFRQLAGRISINWAVEQPRSSGQRFLHAGDSECLVPLRPLGEPKPSAVETYLTQDEHRLARRADGGTLCTYGDTLDDDSAGELNGRKFYLHQPDAAVPEKQQFELRPNKPDWSYVDGRGNTSHHIAGDQAMLARFVSTPRTEFKFTLRFRDLRDWELGAVLFVLTADQPLLTHLLRELGLSTPPQRLQQWLDYVPARWKPQEPNRPLLALKLGHGRPLGLGSIRVAVDAICQLAFNGGMGPLVQTTEVKTRRTDFETQRLQFVTALATKLKAQLGDRRISDWADQVLLPWLQVHRYAGRSTFDYPRPEGGMIYEYHTDRRKRHAAGRKQPPGERSPKPSALMTLDELDRDGK